MSLSEMIRLIGDENIRVQNVFQSSEGMNYSKKKGGTTIRLFTQEVSADDLLSQTPKRIGLVIWFDREIYKKSVLDKAL